MPPVGCAGRVTDAADRPPIALGPRCGDRVARATASPRRRPPGATCSRQAHDAPGQRRPLCPAPSRTPWREVAGSFSALGPPGLPVIVADRLVSFFDSAGLPATPLLAPSSAPRPAAWPRTRVCPRPTGVVRVLQPLCSVSGTAVGGDTNTRGAHHRQDYRGATGRKDTTMRTTGSSSVLEAPVPPRPTASGSFSRMRLHQIRRAAAGVAVAGLHRAR